MVVHEAGGLADERVACLRGGAWVSSAAGSAALAPADRCSMWAVLVAFFSWLTEKQRYPVDVLQSTTARVGGLTYPGGVTVGQ